MPHDANRRNSLFWKIRRFRYVHRHLISGPNPCPDAEGIKTEAARMRRHPQCSPRAMRQAIYRESGLAVANYPAYLAAAAIIQQRSTQ